MNADEILWVKDAEEKLQFAADRLDRAASPRRRDDHAGALATIERVSEEVQLIIGQLLKARRSVPFPKTNEVAP